MLAPRFLRDACPVDACAVDTFFADSEHPCSASLWGYASQRQLLHRGAECTEAGELTLERFRASAAGPLDSQFFQEKAGLLLLATTSSSYRPPSSTRNPRIPPLASRQSSWPFLPFLHSRLAPRVGLLRSGAWCALWGLAARRIPTWRARPIGSRLRQPSPPMQRNWLNCGDGTSCSTMTIASCKPNWPNANSVSKSPRKS